MLKLTLPTALLAGLAFTAHAQDQNQDQPHRFEVGLELVNYAPLAKQTHNYIRSQINDKTQWASGAVFRYNLGRFGLRSGISYTTGTDKTQNINNCADCPVGGADGRDLRLRLGAQYAPITKAPWLYVFSDFYYRSFVSKGNYTGGLCGCLNTDVAVNSHGIGNSTGLGLKIRTWKHFYLNPEVYYDVLRANNTVNTSDRNLGTSGRYDTRTKIQGPAVRLNAIIAF